MYVLERMSCMRQAAAVVGLLVGRLADWLSAKPDWSLVKVRLAMQAAASIGAAASPLIRLLKMPSLILCRYRRH